MAPDRQTGPTDTELWSGPDHRSTGARVGRIGGTPATTQAPSRRSCSCTASPTTSTSTTGKALPGQAKGLPCY
jgi:hypothetical protein